MARIVETDNLGGDYPDESFLPIPSRPREAMQRIANAINTEMGSNCRRYWKVVDEGYELQPGFEL